MYLLQKIKPVLINELVWADSSLLLTASSSKFKLYSEAQNNKSYVFNIFTYIVILYRSCVYLVVTLINSKVEVERE